MIVKRAKKENATIVERVKHGNLYIGSKVPGDFKTRLLRFPF